MLKDDFTVYQLAPLEASSLGPSCNHFKFKIFTHTHIFIDNSHMFIIQRWSLLHRVMNFSHRWRSASRAKGFISSAFFSHSENLTPFLAQRKWFFRQKCSLPVVTKLVRNAAGIWVHIVFTPKSMLVWLEWENIIFNLKKKIRLFLTRYTYLC